jgi:hypothetical protein
MWGLISQPPSQGFLAIRWFSTFFFVGYIIAKYQTYILSFKSQLFLISLFLFPILLPFWDIGVTQFADIGFIRLIISFILALFGITLSYYIVRSLNNTKIYEFLTLCGEFSLEIYIVSNLLALISVITQVHFWFGGGMTSILSGTLIFMLISLIFSMVLSYNMTFSTFLFGRWALKNSPHHIKNHMLFLSTTIVFVYTVSIFWSILKTF